MPSDSSPISVPFRHKNPLRQLAQVTLQVQSEANELLGYELLLGEENISFVVIGAKSMVETVQNLMASSAGGNGEENPLLSQDVRHDLRNQVAVVKGFSELMKMDLPSDHDMEGMLGSIGQLTRDFVEILDSMKYTTTVAEALPMAS